MRNIYHSVKLWLLMIALPLLLIGCGEHVKPTTPDKCTSCEIAVVVFNAINALVDGVMQNMCRTGLLLLGIGYAMWLLIVVANGLLKGQQAGRDFFTGQLIMVGKVAAVAIVLSNTEIIYYICQNIINPFLGVFFDFAAWIIQQGAQSAGLTKETYTPTLSAQPSNILAPSLIESVEVVIYYIQVFIDQLRGWGAVFFKEWVIDQIVGWVGLFIILLSYTLSLAFAFMLLEPFFRLTLFLALMPLWFVAWCFGATKGMAMAAMKKVVVAAGQLFLTSIYFSVLFLFVSAYGVYLEIPELGHSNLLVTSLLGRGIISCWLYFITFCLLYYFLQSMNKSIGYVLNEDLSSFVGSKFLKGLDGFIKQMISAAQIYIKLAKEVAKFAAQVALSVATGGAAAVPLLASATGKTIVLAAKTATKAAVKTTQAVAKAVKRTISMVAKKGIKATLKTGMRWARYAGSAMVRGAKQGVTAAIRKAGSTTVAAFSKNILSKAKFVLRHPIKASQQAWNVLKGTKWAQALKKRFGKSGEKTEEGAKPPKKSLLQRIRDAFKRKPTPASGTSDKEDKKSDEVDKKDEKSAEDGDKTETSEDQEKTDEKKDDEKKNENEKEDDKTKDEKKRRKDKKKEPFLKRLLKVITGVADWTHKNVDTEKKEEDVVDDTVNPSGEGEYLAKNPEKSGTGEGM